MPTQERWLEDNIAATVWISPVRASDLEQCFHALATMIASKDHAVHILFDIADGGHVPASAPILAIRSGLLAKPNTGKVAVVGMDTLAQILAQVATSVSGKEIVFFPFDRSALDWLRE